MAANRTLETCCQAQHRCYEKEYPSSNMLSKLLKQSSGKQSTINIGTDPNACIETENRAPLLHV